MKLAIVFGAAFAFFQDGAPSSPQGARERFTWKKEALPGWRHVTSDSGEFRHPEIVCGGVVLFDCDGDGDLDVFLVNGGVWNDLTPGQPYPGHALFRNDGGMKFTNIAKEAGVFGTDGSYCMGAAAADFDNDGDQDLLVTSYSRIYLYVNDGTGHFVDRAEEFGLRDAGQWSMSAAFFDADGDGRLDLYVTHYLDYPIELAKKFPCHTHGNVRDYCAPKEFAGVQDAYFHQEVDEKGNVHFRECALEVGLKAVEPLSNNAKGLGVIASDLDGDGDLDLYVANDGCANFLFLNDGHGHFEECGAIRGCAFSEDGKSLAGMGVDAGDVDDDGDLDLVCVNLSLEKNDLYVNDGKAWFTDECRRSGLADADHGEVGFGTDLFDVDDDGDLDLIIANGHVLMHAQEMRGTITFEQKDQLFENDGSGHFRVLAPSEAGAWFNEFHAGRGLATGDLDGDGDLDVVIVSRDAAPVLLENNHVPAGRAADAILLDLRGKKSNRDGVGAWLELTVGGKKQVEEVRAGNSYCSRSDLRVHFGLGGAARAESLLVRWPSGERQSVGPLDAGYEYRITESVGGAGGAIEQLRALKR